MIEINGIQSATDCAIMRHYKPDIAILWQTKLRRAEIFTVPSREPTRFVSHFGPPTARWAGERSKFEHRECRLIKNYYIGEHVMVFHKKRYGTISRRWIRRNIENTFHFQSNLPSLRKFQRKIIPQIKIPKTMMERCTVRNIFSSNHFSHPIEPCDVEQRARRFPGIVITTF